MAAIPEIIVRVRQKIRFFLRVQNEESGFFMKKIDDAVAILKTAGQRTLVETKKRRLGNHSAK